MKTLIIATSNRGKLLEIKHILENIPYEIKSSQDVGFTDEVVETGKTFRENAKIKAETIGRKLKYLTIAEDSGLEVDALSGRPGIYSARYVPGSDEIRVNKVLEELKGIPKEERTARFICVAALYNPRTQKTEFFEGVSRGVITQKPAGVNGFGYDPIFYNLDLNKTNAQATLAEKNLVSHRARALNKVKEFLLLKIR